MLGTSATSLATACAGPIPEGMDVDHVKERGCLGYSCVRPDHLEAVSHRENVLRGDGVAGCHARKKLCVRGHEFDRMRQGARYCSTCQKIRDRNRTVARQGQRASEL